MMATGPAVSSARPAIHLRPSYGSASILLTNRCNLTCRHCYVSSGPNGEYGLPMERVLTLLDELYEHFGPLPLAISGGEALVRKDDVFAITDRAQQRHRVQLLTNGTLITRALARRLAATSLYLKISIDGGCAASHDAIRGEGSFAKTLSGLKNLLDAGFPSTRISFGASLPPESVDQVPSLLQLAERFAVPAVRFQSIYPVGRAQLTWPGPQNDPQLNHSATLVQTIAEVASLDSFRQWRFIDITRAVDLFNSIHFYADGSVCVAATANYGPGSPDHIANILNASLREIFDSPRLSHVLMRKFLARCRGPKPSFASTIALRRTTTDGFFMKIARAEH